MLETAIVLLVIIIVLLVATLVRLTDIRLDNSKLQQAMGRVEALQRTRQSQIAMKTSPGISPVRDRALTDQRMTDRPPTGRQVTGIKFTRKGGSDDSSGD